MAKICFDCGKNLTFIDPKIDLKRLRKVAALNGYTDKMITRMNDDDVICVGCSDKLDKKVEEQKLEETVSRNKNILPSQKLSSSGVMADKEIPTKGNPMSPTPKSKPYVQPSTETTTVTSLTTITDLIQGVAFSASSAIFFK